MQKTICTDAVLSAFDDALARAYETALTHSFIPDSTRSDQSRWLRERDACGNASCLRASYRKRFAQLARRPTFSAGQLWPIDSAAGDRNPESERLYQLLVSRGWREPFAAYLDIGDGAYFITIESAPGVGGLFYAVPGATTLQKLWMGPAVDLRETLRLRDGARLYLFAGNGYAYSGYTAIVVHNPLLTPSVTHMANVEFDRAPGGCGDHPERIEVAGSTNSYSIRDLSGDGLLDIEFDIRETVCATNQTQRRLVQYVYVNGAYREREPQ